MKTLVKGTMASLALAVASAGASAAATLGLATEAQPVIDIPFAEIGYIEFGGAGDLFTTAPAPGLATGVTSASEGAFDIFLSFELADPLADPIGVIFSEELNGDPYLDGDLAAIGFEEDILELLFENLSGSAAADFGDTALVELFFYDPVGADPLAGLLDGALYEVAMTISAPVAPVVAPVPLPGGLPLLAGGLVVLALRRARR